jgi:hypothetical protein
MVKSLLASYFARKEESVAQRVITERVSDLDGSPDAETVAFALDGQDYEIDLSPGQAREMRHGVAPFAGKARRVKAPAGTRRAKRPSRTDLPDIREFGRTRGYEINDRGRIPRRIIDEYDTLRKLSVI